jgi:hypothetical protein
MKSCLPTSHLSPDTHCYFSWHLLLRHVSTVIKVFLEIFLEYCVPVTFNETSGNHVVWVRYAEWLLTCPVSHQYSSTVKSSTAL